MLCAEQDALWQEYRAAVHNYHSAIRELVALVDSSAKDSDFDRVHLRIKSARGLCEVAQAAATVGPCAASTGRVERVRSRFVWLRTCGGVRAVSPESPDGGR
jgi:hypothetical protein